MTASAPRSGRSPARAQRDEACGYLLLTFLLEKNNQRRDRRVGSYQNRMSFPLELVRRVCEAVGDGFISGSIF
ncbi:MAG: hypothetical protein ABR578_10515 [Chromatocurvus sp.]